ncbi:Pgr5-like a a isoform 1 [Tripterygium wilfordii]|uniref:Pgr5-like a a isoform 1 n=1 Tax=Tripterygium wilfordii TaxID=458696 RepID=A0A7J7CLC6_TRIWF|nr:PGR5-like protein 1B, chloroplastic [Tripterygium wilfordii]XP_038725213.1 PGR5-like protein 1B, chloroplastic [Tripterygium wilfordii]XP_038725214.1 PGR5-like protein 1B, chloroplastic [Tripterygium wilfordii]KAF5734848.1 Pgr5-like a a isoform 1 [Tripterygium wilfordii]
MAHKLAFTMSSTRLFSAPIQKPLFCVSSSSSCSSTRVQASQLNGRQFCLRRRVFVLPIKATADQQGKVEEEDTVDSKILPYCSIDKKDKKSLGEMEQEFLQALQAFYYEGKAIMSNEEFDNLKEELMWEGSSVVMLSSDEQKFLEASMAYVAGKPIMSDKDYDQLKLKLKTEGSEIVVEGPRCSLRSRKVYSDLYVDYFKMFLLNVPATVVALGLFFFLDDLTGFEITYLLELPEPFSFIFTWFAAVPAIFWIAQVLTKLIVKDFLILKGPCPNCGTENVSFFGTILSVSSGGSTNNLKCSNCGTELVYSSSTRLITLPEGSEA